MSRLPRVTAPTAEQQAMLDSLSAGPRQLADPQVGPFGAWLHSPTLGDKAQALGAVLRYGTSLEPRLSELAILVTARHWMAQFEWTAHAPIALRQGVTQAVIDALRVGAVPVFEKADEASLYAFADNLLRHRRVSQPVYDAAREQFGDAGVVELVGIVGYYSLVALTLNAFDVQPRAGAALME